MINTKHWHVGDVYYAADAELHGRPWDIGEYGDACVTIDEALENARRWQFWLSARERERSRTWVRKWQVDSVEGDGQIGSAHTID